MPRREKAVELVPVGPSSEPRSFSSRNQRKERHSQENNLFLGDGYLARLLPNDPFFPPDLHKWGKSAKRNQVPEVSMDPLAMVSVCKIEGSCPVMETSGTCFGIRPQCFQAFPTVTGLAGVSHPWQNLEVKTDPEGLPSMCSRIVLSPVFKDIDSLLDIPRTSFRQKFPPILGKGAFFPVTAFLTWRRRFLLVRDKVP